MIHYFLTSPKAILPPNPLIKMWDMPHAPDIIQPVEAFMYSSHELHFSVASPKFIYSTTAFAIPPSNQYYQHMVVPPTRSQIMSPTTFNLSSYIHYSQHFIQLLESLSLSLVNTFPHPLSVCSFIGSLHHILHVYHTFISSS